MFEKAICNPGLELEHLPPQSPDLGLIQWLGCVRSNELRALLGVKMVCEGQKWRPSFSEACSLTAIVGFGGERVCRATWFVECLTCVTRLLLSPLPS